MKKLLMIIALVALSSNVMAGNNCNKSFLSDCSSDNSVTTNNKGGAGGKGGEGGTGIGVGIAKADADAAAYAKSIGINYNSLTTQQQTSVKNYVSSSNYQGQGQVGIVKNVGPQVVIEDHKVITYEASSAPAIGPDVNVDQVKVDCPLYIQDGFSLAGSVILGSGSVGATNAELSKICALWLAAKNTQSSSHRREAASAAYCLTFEEVGISNKRCDGWREDLSGVPADEESTTDDSVAWNAGSDRS
jgi:hypothetical protein